MDTKIILKNCCIVFTTFMLIIFFSSTKCIRLEYEPTCIVFSVESKRYDKIIVEYKLRGVKYKQDFPYFQDTGSPVYFIDIHSRKLGEYGDGPVEDLLPNEAMQILKEAIDTVIITRESDAKSVLYCHGENATEKEKFFFTEEAWDIVKEYYNDYGLEEREYRFSIKDELFE